MHVAEDVGTIIKIVYLVKLINFLFWVDLATFMWTEFLKSVLMDNFCLTMILIGLWAHILVFHPNFPNPNP